MLIDPWVECATTVNTAVYSAWNRAAAWMESVGHKPVIDAYQNYVNLVGFNDQFHDNRWDIDRINSQVI